MSRRAAAKYQPPEADLFISGSCGPMLRRPAGATAWAGRVSACDPGGWPGDVSQSPGGRVDNKLAEVL